MEILLYVWLARSRRLTLSFPHLSKKGSGTMAVYSGSVTYTVFSKMAYILTSRCVSLKLQFQHFVKKPGVLAITVLRKLPACSQSCPE